MVKTLIKTGPVHHIVEWHLSPADHDQLDKIPEVHEFCGNDRTGIGNHSTSDSWEWYSNSIRFDKERNQYVIADCLYFDNVVLKQKYYRGRLLKANCDIEKETQKIDEDIDFWESKS